MKITLTLWSCWCGDGNHDRNGSTCSRTPDGSTVAVTVPYDDAPHAEADTACPVCKAPAPILVAGTGKRIVNDREVHADGYHLACKAHLGLLVAKPDTLFGLEEDRRVLHGRPRVY